MTDQIAGETDRSRQGATAVGSTPSTGARWTGRVLSGLAVLFLVFDATLKVLNLAPAVEATTALGYPAGVVVPLGLVQVVCLVVYLTPPTAILGAVLWTGYLGGAVATHVRVGDSFFSMLFPIVVAAFLWGGLWLRDHGLRAVLPVRTART